MAAPSSPSQESGTFSTQPSIRYQVMCHLPPNSLKSLFSFPNYLSPLQILISSAPLIFLPLTSICPNLPSPLLLGSLLKCPVHSSSTAIKDELHKWARYQKHQRKVGQKCSCFIKNVQKQSPIPNIPQNVKYSKKSWVNKNVYE